MLPNLPKHASNVENILARTVYGADVVGAEVKVRIGNRVCMMDYNTAIVLAQMLNWAGRKAKSNARDGSMRMLGIARLTDANADELEAQFNRDRTAVFARVK